MTPLEGGLLLLGLFGVPLGLLTLSHRFRNLGRRARGAFWGGFAGYGVGMVIWFVATIGPAVMWDEASFRLAGIVLPLLGCGVVGVAIGGAIGRTPRRGPKAPRRTRDRGRTSTSSGASSATSAAKSSASALAALLAVGAPALSAQSPGDVFVVREIDANVMLAETAPDVPTSDYAASVAVLGSDGVLLVDTFHGPTAASWFLDRIAERTDAPVRWVVNTHRHGDHVWGNAAVLERFPGAEILAHPATLESMRSEGEAALAAERTRLDGRIATLERRLGELPADDPGRGGAVAALDRARSQRAEVDRVRVVPPTEPVPDFRRIDLGTRTVWVQPLAPAHTEGDVVVWVDGLLVAGDIVEEGLPWLDGGDVESWAFVLESLARRGPAMVIPAHGGLPESVDRAALLHLQRDLLAKVVGYARSLGAGADVDPDAFAALRADLASWGVGRDAFDAWVVRAVAAVR